MASKTEKLVDTVDNMSLFEKQKLIDALLKDGRVNYPFKDKHEKELAEQEAKIKERLTENVKDEFEGIIKSLRHENQRLKDNLEQTGLIYQQHLKNIQQELEIEKEKLVTAMIRKQEQINQQHREEIKKQNRI